MRLYLLLHSKLSNSRFLSVFVLPSIASFLVSFYDLLNDIKITKSPAVLSLGQLAAARDYASGLPNEEDKAFVTGTDINSESKTLQFMLSTPRLGVDSMNVLLLLLLYTIKATSCYFTQASMNQQLRVIQIQTTDWNPLKTQSRGGKVRNDQE